MSDNEVWTLPLPEKYPPLEYYIERVRMLERQLAEAQSALNDIPSGALLWHGGHAEGMAWKKKHAAVLKAAREAK